MKLVYYLLPIALCLCKLGFGQAHECEEINERSGFISESSSRKDPFKKCWKFKVPQGINLHLNLTSLEALKSSCSDVFVKISVSGGEVTHFCSTQSSKKSVSALNDVEVTCSLRGESCNFFGHCHSSTSFRIDFYSDSSICAQKNHFRCSENVCIHQDKVCDGVADCENGSDELECETGVLSIRGVKKSRNDAIAWLKSQMTESFGWKEDTHRAITALYLSGGARFIGDNLVEELMVKQLELNILDALLRNASDPLWISDISMYVNALSVTCHNPRQFYGRDLVQILSDKMNSTTSLRPGACLTLCNANVTVDESHVRRLLKLLSDDSNFPFIQDIQATVVMTLTCIKNKTNKLVGIENATKVLDATIKKFIVNQHSDGSFGNIYTTALVTQALLSNGQEDNKLWDQTATLNFLMQELKASRNFLATYLVLPILNGKSLVDLRMVQCKKTRENSKYDISDITNKRGGKVQVQYSLYVGDLKDVIHTIYLRVPENSTFYDVMRIAQEVDPKYKFLHRKVGDHMYIYEIAGITNDAEALKFWRLFTMESSNNKLIYSSKSADQFVVREKDHLIMWYKVLPM